MASETCYNIVHWIFALKYWSLSFKIQQLKIGRDADVYNKQLKVAFFIGIFLNSLSALFNNLSAVDVETTRKKFTIVALVFTLPLYVSFAILIDAFRRFREIKDSEQVINNSNVSVLSFTYLFYAIAITMMLII